MHNYEPYLLHAPGRRLGRPGHENDRHPLPGPPRKPADTRPQAEAQSLGPQLDQGIQHRADGQQSEQPVAFRAALEQAREWSEYYGRPVHIGEFGCLPTADPEPRALITTRRSAKPPSKLGSAGLSGTGRPASTTGTSRPAAPSRGCAQALFGKAQSSLHGANGRPAFPTSRTDTRSMTVRENLTDELLLRPNLRPSRAQENQSPGRRDQPVSAPARDQPGRLVSLGTGGARQRPSPRASRSSCRSVIRPATGAT